MRNFVILPSKDKVLFRSGGTTISFSIKNQGADAAEVCVSVSQIELSLL